jgi:hypothetical protein
MQEQRERRNSAKIVGSGNFPGKRRRAKPG